MLSRRRRLVKAKAAETESGDSDDDSSGTSMVSEYESLEHDSASASPDDSADEASVDALGSYDDADLEHYQQVGGATGLGKMPDLC